MSKSPHNTPKRKKPTWQNDPRTIKGFEIVGELLESDTHVIELIKDVRSGATTSIIMAAFLKDKNVLIVEPHNKIRKTVESTVEIISNAVGKEPIIRHYGANKDMCLLIQQDIKESGGRLAKEKVPIHIRPKSCCSNNNTPPCEYYEDDACPLQEFYKSNPDIYFMTYARLNSLIASCRYSPMDQKILLKILKKVDLVIFDECSILERLGQRKIKSRTLENIISDEMMARINESNMSKGQKKFVQDLKTIAKNLKDMGFKEGQVFENKLFNRRMTYPLMKFFYNNIKMNIHVNESYKLIKLVPSLNKKRFYNTKGKKEKNETWIPDITDEIDGVRGSFNLFKNENIKMIFMDATVSNIPLKKLLIDEKSSEDIPKKYWGDPMEKNQKILFVADSSRRPENFVKMIIDDLLLNGFDCKQIRITVMNRSKKTELSLDDVKYNDLEITYYRAPGTLGTESTRRINIMVGKAHTPLNCNDAEAYFYNLPKEYRNTMRMVENSNTFKQAAMRVADPKGEEKSIVFCVGMPKKDIQQTLYPRRYRDYVEGNEHQILFGEYNVIKPPLKSGMLTKCPSLFMEIWSKYEILPDDVPYLVHTIYEFRKGHRTFSRIFRTDIFKKNAWMEARRILDRNINILRDFKIDWDGHRMREVVT